MTDGIARTNDEGKPEQKTFLISYSETYEGDFLVSANTAEEALARFRDTLGESAYMGDYVSSRIEMTSSESKICEHFTQDGVWKSVNMIDLPIPSPYKKD